jgi:hypothetical protein
MQLSEDAIREYISLYKDDFGETLTIEEAREMASALVALYELLCRRLPGEQLTPPSSDNPDPPRIGFLTS